MFSLFIVLGREQRGELKKPKGYTCLVSPFSQRNILRHSYSPAQQVGNIFMLFQPKANQELAQICLALPYRFSQASTRMPGPHRRAMGHQRAAECSHQLRASESWWGHLMLTVFTRITKEGSSSTLGGFCLLTAALLCVKIKLVNSKVLLTVTVLNVRMT